MHLRVTIHFDKVSLCKIDDTTGRVLLSGNGVQATQLKIGDVSNRITETSEYLSRILGTEVHITTDLE